MCARGLLRLATQLIREASEAEIEDALGRGYSGAGHYNGYGVGR
jgi:hypothetical protein